MIKRTGLLAAAAAILCIPASASAAGSSGVVLTASAAHHALQVVDRTHVVHAYHVAGKLPAVSPGSRVRFHASGSSIGHVAVGHRRAGTVKFLARVLKTGRSGVLLRLGDNKLERLRAKPARVAGAHRSIAPGTIVLVTLRLAPATSARSHSRRPAFSLVPVSGTSETGAPQASGQVVEMDPGTIVLQDATGKTLRFAVPAPVLSGLQLSLCDTVEVLYHKSGATLVADTVKELNLSNTGACNTDGGAGGDGGTDVIGAITQLTVSGLTITTPGGAATFLASPDLTEGFVIGDQVDVTYVQGPGSAPTANDVEYVDQDATGTATYIDSGTLTMVDDTTGKPETFTDDPSNGSFDGINPGDQVDVSYHVSQGRTVVDSVSDMTNPN
jgi:hypothetical protein